MKVINEINGLRIVNLLVNNKKLPEISSCAKVFIVKKIFTIIFRGPDQNSISINTVMKICEVLESSEAKHALKTIQPRKSSSRAIKPISTIKSKPPLSPEKLRQKSLKLNVERAKEAAKHDREVNKWNQH